MTCWFSAKKGVECEPFLVAWIRIFFPNPMTNLLYDHTISHLLQLLSVTTFFPNLFGIESPTPRIGSPALILTETGGLWQKKRPVKSSSRGGIRCIYYHFGGTLMAKAWGRGKKWTWANGQIPGPVKKSSSLGWRGTLAKWPNPGAWVKKKQKRSSLWLTH